MDALTELNTVGLAPGLPTRRIQDLPLGHQFPIVALQRIDTRYGARILCTCPDFVVFLPAKFSALSDTCINAPLHRRISFMYEGKQNGASTIRFTEEPAV